ncbi:MAG TPA: hypothetical protein VIY49_02470 [Bryobacteraceae bacterium]
MALLATACARRMERQPSTKVSHDYAFLIADQRRSLVHCLQATPMPLLTILSGLAVLALKKGSGADPVRQMLDTVVGGAAGNQFFTDFHNIRRGMAQWLRGIHPDQNMAIERAVLRSALHADLFCLIEAAGEPLELPANRAERWLQILRDRLPDRLKHLHELPGGFFEEAGVGQLRLARRSRSSGCGMSRSSASPARSTPTGSSEARTPITRRKPHPRP